ncbi:hypothetical protein [Paenibacillus sp. GYB003]|uniref:hypothetical protein n=1 Tax=Paenibacillus sp. GYB003 TaxID=2994392 RepID=UPI002F962EEB
MLQIISGKFYGDRHIHENKGRGILYSNFSWFNSIETDIASLEPADLHGDVKGYVISYVNKLESDEGNGFSLVRTGDSEIVQQFRLLCSFGLNAYFDHDKVTVQMNCREKSVGIGDDTVPAQFVPKFFKREINGTAVEVDNLISFVKHVIGLKREDYNNVIACLTNYLDALEAVNYNIDLAYSMIIYSLEALSKKYNDYTPSWLDYDQRLKKELEAHFETIDGEKAQGIKDILVKSAHLKLQQNFIDFVCRNLSDSFFEEESFGVTAALKKSELKRALRNAYILRSGYVHELRTILKQLKIHTIAAGDVYNWQGEPYLTFSGLIRVFRHVVKNFIWSRETVTTENINWRSELPGVVSVELAPQYWVWKHESFLTSHATGKFSGFLSQLAGVLSQNEPLTDLKELLEKYIVLLPNAKRMEKVSMYCMFFLYTISVREEHRPVNHQKFISDNTRLTEMPCIENMVTYLYIGQDWPWEKEVCQSTYDEYNTSRFSANSLKLPSIFEIGILCRLANLCDPVEDSSNRTRLFNQARHEAAGLEQIQKYIEKCLENECDADISHILKGCREELDESGNTFGSAEPT